MYDAKTEANEFVGDTREEAVTKAARFYGVAETELTIKEPGLGEIFGLGARTVVVAFPKDMKPRPQGGGGDRGDRSDRSDRGGRSDRGDRGGRGDRGDRPRGRERGRGRGGEGGSDRDGGRRPERASDPLEDQGSDVGSGRSSDQVEDERAERSGAQASAPAPRTPSGPSKGAAIGALTEIGEYLLGMVERMQLGSFELREAEDGEFVVLDLKGEAADALSAGESRAVGALQLLLNQAAMRASESPKRIVLDCGGNEGQRESFLERQAGRAAARALETGRAVALDPMNSADRRALHMAVRAIDDVVTMSVGSGRYRQVVIVPVGADEYEEALRASEEAEVRGRARE